MGDKPPNGKKSITKTFELEVTVTESSPNTQNNEPGGDATGSPLAAIVDLSDSLNRAQEAIDSGQDAGETVQQLNRDFNKILADLPQNSPPQRSPRRGAPQVFSRYGPYLPRRIPMPAESPQSPTTYWDDTPTLAQTWAPEAASTPDDERGFDYEGVFQGVRDLYPQHPEYRPLEQETIAQWSPNAFDVSTQSDPESTGSLDRGWRVQAMPTLMLTEEELEERRIRREQRATFDSTPSSTGSFLDFSLMLPEITSYTELTSRYSETNHVRSSPEQRATSTVQPRSPSPQRSPSPAPCPQRTPSPGPSPHRSPSPSPRQGSPPRQVSPPRPVQEQLRVPSPFRPPAPSTTEMRTPRHQMRTQRVLVSSTNLHRDLSTNERGDDLDVGLEILRVMEMQGVLHDDYLTDEEVSSFLHVPPRPERTWESRSPTLRSPSPVEARGKPPCIPDEPLPRFRRRTRIPKPDPPGFNWQKYFRSIEGRLMSPPPSYNSSRVPARPSTRTPAQGAAAQRRQASFGYQLTPDEEKECDAWIASLMPPQKFVDGRYITIPPAPPLPPPPRPAVFPRRTQRRRRETLGIMKNEDMTDLDGGLNEQQLAEFLMSTPARPPPGFVGRKPSLGIMSGDQTADFEGEDLDEETLSQFVTPTGRPRADRGRPSSLGLLENDQTPYFEGEETSYQELSQFLCTPSGRPQTGPDEQFQPFRPGLPTGPRPDVAARSQQWVDGPPGWTMSEQELVAQRQMYEEIQARARVPQEFPDRSLPGRYPRSQSAPSQCRPELSPTQFPAWVSDFHRAQQPSTSSSYRPPCPMSPQVSPRQSSPPRLSQPQRQVQAGLPPCQPSPPRVSQPQRQVQAGPPPCQPSPPRVSQPQCLGTGQVVSARQASPPRTPCPQTQRRAAVRSDTSLMNITPVQSGVTQSADAEDEWESLSPPSPIRPRVERKVRVKPKKTRSASFVLPSRARTEEEFAMATAARTSSSTSATFTTLERTPSGRVKKVVRFSEEISQREIPSREELRRQEISERMSRYGTSLRPPRTASTYRPQISEEDLPPPQPVRRQRVPLEGPVYGPHLPYMYGSSRAPPRTAAGRLSYPYQPPPRSPPTQQLGTPPRRPLSISPRSSVTPLRGAVGRLSQPPSRAPARQQQISRRPMPLATSTPLQSSAMSPCAAAGRLPPPPSRAPQRQQQCPRRPVPLATSTPLQPSATPQRRPTTPLPDPTRDEACFIERTQMLQERLELTEERIRNIECELFSPVSGMAGLPSMESGTLPSPEGALSISPDVTSEIVQGFVRTKRGVSRLQGIVQNRLEKGAGKATFGHFTLR